MIEQSLPSSSTQEISESAVINGGGGGGGGGGGEQPAAGPNPSGLKSLTLELSDYNLHIQVVAPRVLLCLIGPKQPTRHTSSSSSLHSQEGGGGGVGGGGAEVGNKGTPPGSVPKSGGTPAVGSVGSGVAGTGSLGILKTQAQALVNYLEKELKGFELPEGI